MMQEDDANSTKGPFLELPICSYHGHSADVLDLSWSKVCVCVCVCFGVAVTVV